MVAPEALLLELAEHDAAIGRLIVSTGPLVTPYGALARENGWLVDAASRDSTAPFDDPGVVADQRITNALLVACDYAVRRGANTPCDVVRILKRETPLGVVVNPAAPGPTALARKLGIAVASLSEQPLSFARRATAHSALSFECDPVLSFQPRTLDWDMGDNSLSSFLVHNEGSGDSVVVTGEMSERWAVEVGLPPSTPLESLPEIELEVAVMPCFLSGVTSLFDGQALEVGWAAGEAPEIEQIGECIQVWTKVLFDMHAVDVRIVFATPRGRAPVLTAMRARARAFRASRDASISDRANVLAPVAIAPSLGGIVNG